MTLRILSPPRATMDEQGFEASNDDNNLSPGLRNRKHPQITESLAIAFSPLGGKLVRLLNFLPTEEDVNLLGQFPRQFGQLVPGKQERRKVKEIQKHAVFLRCRVQITVAG